MKEIIASIRNPVEGDYGQCFPHELPSRADLEKLRPNLEWAERLGIKDPNLAQRNYHGFGHNARIIVFDSLLLPKLEERFRKEGVVISREQKAALRLSEITHDFGREKDFELILAPHQKRSARKDWLKSVFFDLKGRQIDLFQNVSWEKVVILASQINRVHDYRDDIAALKTLQTEYDHSLEKLPLELDIFKDLDAGLERLRTEEWFKRKPMAEIIVKILRKRLINPSSEKSLLHWLHFPHFEATRELLPFAIKLYHSSIENPKYKKDQWEATMDTAQALGAIRV